MQLQGVEVKKVDEFKYLESSVQSNGECGREVQAKLRKVAGAICDRKVSASVKRQILQDCGETSYVLWLRDDGTDRKSGGRTSGSQT